jgi:hypothetical protein
MAGPLMDSSLRWNDEKALSAQRPAPGAGYAP